MGFELPFEGNWESLVALAARFVPSPELERKAQEMVRERLQRISSVIIRPYDQWISEDYYVFCLDEIEGNPTGADLLARHGDRSRASCAARLVSLREVSGPTLCSQACRTIPMIW